MSTRLDPDTQGKTGTASVPIGPTPKQATTQTRAGSEILAAVAAKTHCGTPMPGSPGVVGRFSTSKAQAP